MKKWIYRIGKEDRQRIYNNEELDRECVERGLKRETVNDCYAKALYRFQQGLCYDVDEEFDNILSKSEVLSRSRGQTSHHCQLAIYNGIITQGIVNHKDILSDKSRESIRFTENGMTLLTMGWQDILFLSGIYSIIADKARYKRYSDISMTTEELAGLLLPNGKVPDNFHDIVNGSIRKFQNLEGVRRYHDQLYGDKEELLFKDYFIDSEFSDGETVFCHVQDYMRVCEIQKRLVHIDEGQLLKSRTLDEQFMRTYILWRKGVAGNSKGAKRSDSIKQDTLFEQVGIYPDKSSTKLLYRVVKSIDGVRMEGRNITWGANKATTEAISHEDHETITGKQENAPESKQTPEETTT